MLFYFCSCIDFYSVEITEILQWKLLSEVAIDRPSEKISYMISPTICSENFLFLSLFVLLPGEHNLFSSEVLFKMEAISEEL